MKHTHYLLLVALITLFYSCDPVSKEKNDAIVESNFIKFEVGDMWLYKDLFINDGISEFKNIPDTLIRYSFIRAIKDTVIDSIKFTIMEGMDYDINEVDIDSFPKRVAVSLNESECITLYFDGSNLGLMGGPLRDIQTPDIKIWNKITRNELKVQFVNFNAISTRSFDNSTFMDKVYPLVFPLKIDTPWYYRQPEDTSGGLVYRKKYLGKETITIRSGSFESYKCEMLASEALGSGNIKSYYQWYSDIGMLREYFDFGSSSFTDDTGKPLGTAYTSQVIEYIGHYSIDPDTLKPWGIE